MPFLQDIFGSAANSVLDGKLGGLNTGVAGEAVAKLLRQSGDTVAKVARIFGFMPNEAKTLAFIKEQAEAAGVLAQTEELLGNLDALGALWKKLNASDWEEFTAETKSDIDLTPWQPLLDAATAHKQYARALQAAAEWKFPKLYLLRCIAVGVTASDEDWFQRAKLNTFRTFFLRAALPGDQYDKYVEYYVIVTSEKDAWDEMRSGQDGKIGFLIDSIVNIAAAKLGSHFEEQLGSAIAKEFSSASADAGASPTEAPTTPA
ncbi:MAG: hypothetical protein ACOYMN_04480 [Roseimicrobium sp.]